MAAAAAAPPAPREHPPELKPSSLTRFYDYLQDPRIKVNPFQGMNNNDRRQRLEEKIRWSLKERRDDKDDFLQKLEQLEISQSNVQILKRLGLEYSFGTDSRKFFPLIEGIKQFNLRIRERHTPGFIRLERELQEERDVIDSLRDHLDIEERLPQATIPISIQHGNVKRGVIFEEIDKSITREVMEVPVVFLRWCRRQQYRFFSIYGRKKMDNNVLIAKIGTPLLHDWYGAALAFERNLNKSYSMVLKIIGPSVVFYQNTPQIYTDVYNVEVSSLPLQNLSVYAVKNKTGVLIQAIFGYRGKYSPGSIHAYDDVDSPYDDITRITRKDRYDIVEFFIAYIKASEKSVKTTKDAVDFLQTQVEDFSALEKGNFQYYYEREGQSSAGRSRRQKRQLREDWYTKDMLYHFSQFLKTWYEIKWSKYTSIMDKYFKLHMDRKEMPFFALAKIAKAAEIEVPEWVSRHYERILEEQSRYESERKRPQPGDKEDSRRNPKRIKRTVLFI